MTCPTFWLLISEIDLYICGRHPSSKRNIYEKKSMTYKAFS